MSSAPRPEEWPPAYQAFREALATFESVTEGNEQEGDFETAIAGMNDCIALFRRAGAQLEAWCREVAASRPAPCPDVTLQLRVALHYLSRASASCRNGDPQREGPLHWPVAVDVARRALTAALGELDSAEAGMAWWNALAPDERSEWMERAGSACPADAWRAYRRAREQEAQP